MPAAAAVPLQQAARHFQRGDHRDTARQQHADSAVKPRELNTRTGSPSPGRRHQLPRKVGAQTGRLSAYAASPSNAAAAAGIDTCASTKLPHCNQHARRPRQTLMLST